MILLIDNYDSFTYNLVQRIGEIDPTLDVRVLRNDAATAEEMAEMKPEKVIISPGPCTPAEAGVSRDVIKLLSEKTPILGVCLGHQCMGDVFGGAVVRNERIMHGKTSLIHHNGKGVFRGMSNPFEAARYHSLVIRKDSVPAELEVTAWTDENEVMGVRHRNRPMEGVQFHPESFMTPEGHTLLRNFLEA
jgi:anthranilate synthase/aminodeoxychorismate synthase-like glutamine amidotransferase